MLDADPLSVIGGELDHKPQLPILLALTEEHDPAGLRTWLRASGPRGRPIDLLLARDFGAFEDALGAFSADGGAVIRIRKAPPRSAP